VEARAGISPLLADGKSDSVLRIGSGFAAFAGVASPMTQALAIAIEEEVSPAELDSFEEFYRTRGATPAVHITPWTSVAFTNGLIDRGYRVAEYNNVFVRGVSSYDKVCRPGLEVRLAKEEELDDAARASAAAFASPEMSEDDLYSMMRGMYGAGELRTYVGVDAGQIVASATSFIAPDEKVIGLFGAGTKPEFRGRGFQTALVERRLNDALAAGCEIATVQTLPGSPSHRNVARRGFELAYTKTILSKSYAS
jgi:GNAT superfamily N-acetyltransferase